MPRIPTHAVTAGLLGAGALVWALAARPVVHHPDLATQLNPFGINRSPYGEVFAMAMQGPIDTYFHKGGEDHDCGPECGPECDHDHAAETAARQPELAANAALPDRFRSFIDGLTVAANTRTNPKPATPAHQLYMRRQTEDKLRFAYNLDPAHYSNYAIYHLFLTHRDLGTRPELTPGAAKLAQDTIDYCLKQEGDPRPALTAAAAAENMLELMINDIRSDTPHFTIPQMQQILALLDHCLSRHLDISQQWEASGNWDLLSAFRREEIKDRLHFVNKVRQAEAATIQNLLRQSNPQQVSKDPTPHPTPTNS